MVLVMSRCGKVLNRKRLAILFIVTWTMVGVTSWAIGNLFIPGTVSRKPYVNDYPITTATVIPSESTITRSPIPALVNMRPVPVTKTLPRITELPSSTSSPVPSSVPVTTSLNGNSNVSPGPEPT